MNFVDRTIAALADPATRSGVFDQTALEAIVGSGYDAASVGTVGPYAAIFDAIELGPDLSATPAVAGSWQQVDGSPRIDVQLALTGMADSGAPTVAAVWTGSVSAKAIVGDAHIASFTDTWTGDGVDFKSSSVVTISAPSNSNTPAALTFPIVAAVFVADTPISILEIIRSSTQALARLAKTNPVSPPPTTLPVTGLPIAVWIVPATTFDDADWPGATGGMTPDQARTARRERAATWLAAQHVALAAAS